MVYAVVSDKKDIFSICFTDYIIMLMFAFYRIFPTNILTHFS